MIALRKFLARSAVAAATVAASSGLASADSRLFVAYLYGGNETPVAGDTNAFGIATVSISAAGSICYSILLHNAVAATAAHIHAGVAGVAGGVSVTLPVTGGTPTRNSGCVSAGAVTVTAIKNNPQNFYVNVHNAAFSGGAARGQLQ